MRGHRQYKGKQGREDGLDRLQNLRLLELLHYPRARLLSEPVSGWDHIDKLEKHQRQSTRREVQAVSRRQIWVP